jgi:hypothetical protein
MDIMRYTVLILLVDKVRKKIAPIKRTKEAFL